MSIQGLQFYIGFELEFYLTKNNQQIADYRLVLDFISQLKANIDSSFSNYLLDIKKEQGQGQIEIVTKASNNLVDLLGFLHFVKGESIKLAKKFNLFANFAPTPFIDDCSSSFQINLSLKDDFGRNLFINDADKQLDKNNYLFKSIAGVLSLTKANISNFTNLKKDNPRFNIKRNQELFKKLKYTSPVSLSWGYDNRSCAIRIVGLQNSTRLEFRVADSDIDYKNCLNIFLNMVKYGIKNNLNPPQPIYGNAFDSKYLSDSIIISNFTC